MTNKMQINQEERIIHLYRVTCLINQKIYIGQTVDTNSRWRAHRRDAANPKNPFHSAIKKYGAHNFEFEVIASCKNQDNANELETILVAQYDSFVSNGKGYNATHGGMNAPKSEEWKAHMSKATKKRFEENPEYKELLLLSQKQYNQSLKEQGITHPGTFQEGHEVKQEWTEAVKQARAGVKTPDNILLKQSDAMKRAWAVGKFNDRKESSRTDFHHTEISKQEISEAHTGKHYSPTTEFKKGHIPPNKGKYIQTNTGRTHFKKGQEPANKIKLAASVEEEIRASKSGARTLAKKYGISRDVIRRIRGLVKFND